MASIITNGYNTIKEPKYPDFEKMYFVLNCKPLIILILVTSTTSLLPYPRATLNSITEGIQLFIQMCIGTGADVPETC